MSPHNRGRQIGPAYATVTSVIQADQMAAYPQAPEFDSSAASTLYREQPVLYAGEVYQQGVAAPEQLHFSQTYSQYPLFSSATQLSPPLDSTSPTAASYFSDGTHNAEAFTHAPPYAASDTSNLDDILEDGDFAATAPSSGTASATEEEKRRRNQAASARFRQKKKAREAQMERSLKELAQKKDELELRCAKLEVENKFLKDLLTEKDSNRRERGSVSMVVSGRGKGKAAARDLDFGDDEMKEVDDRKDGVGTDF